MSGAGRYRDAYPLNTRDERAPTINRAGRDYSDEALIPGHLTDEQVREIEATGEYTPPTDEEIDAMWAEWRKRDEEHRAAQEHHEDASA